jgi:DNA modification methylase
MNKIYNENCLDTMARMKDNFIDLTVTSPPYDGLRTYNGYSFDFESIAKELYRTTKEGGVVVWIIGDATIKGSESGTSFKQALFFKECGFNLHDTMIWQKPSVPPTQHNRYQQTFEYMFVFSKGKPKTFNPLKEPSKTVGRIRKTHRSGNNNHKLNDEGVYVTKAEKTIGNNWNLPICNKKIDHPAKFPEQLVNNHIISWSNENDLIYDPFMGSGTTAVAAKLNNRNYLGSETSLEYCEIAEQRLNNNGTLF